MGAGWFRFYYFGSADLISTLLPNISVIYTFNIKSWATASSLNVTKPNPRDYPVLISFKITADSISPY